MSQSYSNNNQGYNPDPNLNNFTGGDFGTNSTTNNSGSQYSQTPVGSDFSNNPDPNQFTSQNQFYPQNQNYPDPNAQTQPGAYQDPYATSTQNFNQAQVDPYANQGYPQQPDSYTQNYPDPNLNQNYQDPYAQTQPGAYQDPYANQPYTQNQSTFKEKQSGSNLFLYISIIIVVILLISTGILIFLINSRDTQNNDIIGQNSSVSESASSNPEMNPESSSSSSSLEESSSVTSSVSSVTSFDPNKTPAENAKIRDAADIPADWLQRFFVNGEVDANGNCLNLKICGISADPDEDGLTNLDEYNYDTDPKNPDTDNDGLSDGNEVYVYFSNPKEADSDRDRIKDGTEIVNCYDPNSDEISQMSIIRLNQIKSEASVRGLREPTISALKNAGATQQDLLNGYIQARCSGV